MELYELNHWWSEKAVKREFVPDTYRNLYVDIKKDMKRKQIQVLIGLRRTGKSTIFYQLINKLIKDKVNPIKIIYISFDKTEFQKKRIEEILKEYAKHTEIDYKTEKIFLFIDEIQKSKNWIDDLKLIYDNYKNIKILISGSASLDILSKSRKNLAGRTIYYELKPLDFKEFLELKKVKYDKKHPLFFKDILEKEYNNYVYRSFPEIINEKDENFIKDYIKNSVLDPVLLKDIPKEFQDVDIILLEKLVNIFLSNPGEYLNVDDLSKDLKRAKKTIYNALFYLEFSYIIKKILNYRPSTKSASRKLSRIYSYHPILSFPFNVNYDDYIENLVGFELNAKYYWRDKEKEIDFLNANLIPVEVKNKYKIKKRDLRWMKYFLSKFGKKLNVNKGFIITKDCEGKVEKVEMLPFWKFSFFGITINS